MRSFVKYSTVSLKKGVTEPLSQRSFPLYPLAKKGIFMVVFCSWKIASFRNPLYCLCAPLWRFLV